MARTLSDWYDDLPPELVAVAIRLGMGKGDRNPQTLALIALEELPWMLKKEQAPELAESREEMLDLIRQTVSDNAGDEPGVMVRLVPYLATGKSVRGWTRTAQGVVATDSWTESPRGESAEGLFARGMAEAVASMARSQVAFMDKATDMLAVAAEAVRTSQEAQIALLHEQGEMQRQVLDSIAEDLGQAAEDLSNMPEAEDNDLKRQAFDLMRELLGGVEIGPESEPIITPPPESD